MSNSRTESRRVIHRSKVSDNDISEEQVIDISQHGMFVLTRASVELGDKIEFDFPYFSDRLEHISGKGKIVRVQNDPPGVGIEFLELAPHSKRVIERLCTTQRTDL